MNNSNESIASEAELLLESPESERPRKVLDLLRSKMHYTYNENELSASKFIYGHRYFRG